jgi:Domain of unknown function (DUF5666)
MTAPSLLLSMRRLLAGLGVLSAAAIAACGGAIGSGGTGAAPPTVSGTVTGFGSVIIDGVRFDERTVTTVAEDSPGTEVLAETRMGHRVELEVDAGGQAQALRVEASVIGLVTSTSVTAPQAGSFVVLGQTITVNADAAAGPVTQFGNGYASAPDLRVGDVVEVHGAVKTSAGALVTQATRVEKRPALPAYLRVSGVVTGLDVGAPGRFTLGALTVDASAASIAPAGATLANGVPVLVFAPAASLGALPGGGPLLSAGTVRIKTLRSSGTSETYASGFVAQLDAASGRFQLNGLTVNYTPAMLLPVGTSLSNGQYVQARGNVSANGSLVAAQVKRRDGRSEPEAELKGTIVNFDSVANTLRIRDVFVALTGAELESCPNTGLRDGLFVELEGTLGPSGVTARKVGCKAEPDSAVIAREGVAGAVDLAAASFTLTPEGRPAVAVRWTAATFFRSVTPQTMGGLTVEVEGTLVNGILEATKIKVDD